jgi:hypothetical protein
MLRVEAQRELPRVAQAPGHPKQKGAVVAKAGRLLPVEGIMGAVVKVPEAPLQVGAIPEGGTQGEAAATAAASVDVVVSEACLAAVETMAFLVVVVSVVVEIAVCPVAVALAAVEIVTTEAEIMAAVGVIMEEVEITEEETMEAETTVADAITAEETMGAGVISEAETTAAPAITDNGKDCSVA